MRRNHVLCVSIAAGAALVALSQAPAHAQNCFKITDLGKIRGGIAPPGPFGINNHNEAVFTVDVALVGLTKNHAFVYLPVAAYGLAAGCHDLHALAGLDTRDPDSQSVVHDLNDAGIAVGSATIDHVTHAFVWRLDTMDFFDLGTYLTGTTSVAWAINDESPVPIIVGEGNLLDDCECPQPDPPQDNDFVSVAYRLALTVVPPTLLNAIQLKADPAEECDFQTFARDASTPPLVFQVANVAGFSSNGGTFCIVFAPCEDPKDATVWLQGSTSGTVMSDLSAGGSECRGVGDNGGFSGWRFHNNIVNECQPEAIYWHTSPSLGPLILGSLITPDGSSQAERINSTLARRQVVGWRNSLPDDGAFLWECSADCGILANWTLTDLNAVEVSGPCSENWKIKRAYDVNDGGVIIASGVRLGGHGRHALLLTPDPACCPADLDGNGTVGVNDLLILLADWGPCPNCGSCGVDCVADIDCDCDVGDPDLLILLGAWGPCS